MNNVTLSDHIKHPFTIDLSNQIPLACKIKAVLGSWGTFFFIVGGSALFVFLGPIKFYGVNALVIFFATSTVTALIIEIIVFYVVSYLAKRKIISSQLQFSQSPVPIFASTSDTHNSSFSLQRRCSCNPYSYFQQKFLKAAKKTLTADQGISQESIEQHRKRILLEVAYEMLKEGEASSDCRPPYNYLFVIKSNSQEIAFVPEPEQDPSTKGGFIDSALTSVDCPCPVKEAHLAIQNSNLTIDDLIKDKTKYNQLNVIAEQINRKYLQNCKITIENGQLALTSFETSNLFDQNSPYEEASNIFEWFTIAGLQVAEKLLTHRKYTNSQLQAFIYSTGFESLIVIEALMQMKKADNRIWLNSHVYISFDKIEKNESSDVLFVSPLTSLFGEQAPIIFDVLEHELQNTWDPYLDLDHLTIQENLKIENLRSVFNSRGYFMTPKCLFLEKVSDEEQEQISLGPSHINFDLFEKHGILKEDFRQNFWKTEIMDNSAGSIEAKKLSHDQFWSEIDKMEFSSIDSTQLLKNLYKYQVACFMVSLCHLLFKNCNVIEQYPKVNALICDYISGHAHLFLNSDVFVIQQSDAQQTIMSGKGEITIQTPLTDKKELEELKLYAIKQYIILLQTNKIWVNSIVFEAVSQIFQKPLEIFVYNHFYGEEDTSSSLTYHFKNGRLMPTLLIGSEFSSQSPLRFTLSTVSGDFSHFMPLIPKNE